MIGEHLVVVAVLPPQQGSARGATFGIGDKRVFEIHSRINKMGADLGQPASV